MCLVAYLCDGGANLRGDSGLESADILCWRLSGQASERGTEEVAHHRHVVGVVSDGGSILEA